MYCEKEPYNFRQSYYFLSLKDIKQWTGQKDITLMKPATRNEMWTSF